MMISVADSTQHTVALSLVAGPLPFFLPLMVLDTWASWALVWGSGLKTINGSSNCYFPARAVMNGGSTLQLWDRYRNIFIRRRMVREASKMSPGVCGATGLASGLLGVLNSDEPGYRLEEVVLTGLRILEGQRAREALHMKLQGTAQA